MASDYGVPVNMRLSVQYMEASANASHWDGKKGSELSVVPHLTQFQLYKAFSAGYLHDVAGAVQENQEKALSYLTMGATEKRSFAYTRSFLREAT